MQSAIIFIAFLCAYPEKENCYQNNTQNNNRMQLCTLFFKLTCFTPESCQFVWKSAGNLTKWGLLIYFPGISLPDLSQLMPFVSFSSYTRNVSRPQWQICTFGQESYCDFKNRCEKHHVASWEGNKNMRFNVFIIFRNKNKKKAWLPELLWSLSLVSSLHFNSWTLSSPIFLYQCVLWQNTNASCLGMVNCMDTRFCTSLPLFLPLPAPESNAPCLLPCCFMALWLLSSSCGLPLGVFLYPPLLSRAASGQGDLSLRVFCLVVSVIVEWQGAGSPPQRLPNQAALTQLTRLPAGFSL